MTMPQASMASAYLFDMLNKLQGSMDGKGIETMKDRTGNDKS
jgi:hypothetical protein